MALLDRWVILHFTEWIDFMNITISESKKKCFFWHRWKLAFGDSITMYSVCEKCKSRKAVQIDSVYQPVDWDWLNKSKSN
jgi:hypothetical protein